VTSKDDLDAAVKEIEKKEKYINLLSMPSPSKSQNGANHDMQSATPV